MRSKKGFSSVELVVALVIISAAIALLLPRYLRSVREGGDRVCAINRASIVRQFQAHQILDPDCQLQDVLDGKCTDFEDDISDYCCPDGGLYLAGKDGRIYCSKHGW